MPAKNEDLHGNVPDKAELTGDICVLFTANDAYMRDFHIVVPADCVASSSVEENEHALRHMERVLKADARPSSEIDFEELKRCAVATGQR